MSDVRSLPKFNGTDFTVWKTIMLAHLTAQGKEQVISQNYPIVNPKATADQKAEMLEEIESFKQNDDEVKSLLFITIDIKIVKQVMNLHTSKDIWERLISIHEQKSSAIKIMKQKEFFASRLRKEENMSDYVARAELLHSQLQECGVTGIDTNSLMNTIISGLPSSYQSFITNWTDREENRQTMDELIARLMSEEMIINKYRKKDRFESVHVATTNSKGKNAKKIGQKSTKHSDTTKTPYCVICRKKGHIKTHCPKYDPNYTPKKKSQDTKTPTKEVNQKSGKADKNEDKSANQKENYDEDLIAEESNLSEQPTSSWIIDCGSSRHMTNSRSDFVSYEKLDPPRIVKFGGSQTAEGIGFGRVKIISLVNNERRTGITSINPLPY